MTRSRLYRGTVNNGVHTYYGELSHAVLARRIELAKNYGWKQAHELLPHDEPIATFVREENLEFYLGFVTGTLAELQRWISEYELIQVDSYLDNGVPFSNGNLQLEANRSLSDEQFRSVFGFDRPWDAASQPHMRPSLRPLV